MIQITKANFDDWQLIQRLATETFVEAFAAANNESDIRKYLEDSFNATTIQAELSNPDSTFFVAWDGDDAVGYLKVNSGYAQTEKLDLAALEIERIYVRSSHHGKKVGQQLYEKAVAQALQHQSPYVWLGVWEENAKAIRFYEKNGFVVFDQHIFKVGNDEQVDLMMKKEL